MVKNKFIDNMEKFSGWRKPGNEEWLKIVKYCTAKYVSYQNFTNWVTLLLVAIGAVAICRNNPRWTFAILVFLGAMWFISDFRTMQDKYEMIICREYRVMYATVTNYKAKGFRKKYEVTLTSETGENMGGGFCVNRKDLDIGTRVLVVYISPDKIKGGMLLALTSFMVSEEGINSL